MSRWKASAIHVCISAAIAAVMVGVMLMLWYPPPYFEAMGGGMLIALIVGCDVAIGPLITLIIFKSGKKGLKTDLAIIGCVQLAALAYGTYTIFIARPVFTVFAVDRFEVVAANGIKSEELAKGTSPAFSTLSLTGPRVVAARLPSDPQERSRIMTESLAGGDDIQNLPRLYVPYDSVAKEAGSRAQPISRLIARNAGVRARVDELLRSAGLDENSCWLLALESPQQEHVGNPGKGLGADPRHRRRKPLVALRRIERTASGCTAPLNPSGRYMQHQLVRQLIDQRRFESQLQQLELE